MMLPRIPRSGHDRSGRRSHALLWLPLLGLAAAGIVLYLAVQKRSETAADLQKRKKTEQAGRLVETAVAKKSGSERTLLLTGESRPYYSVTLYARVSGFLDRLEADIGDTVRKDQRLAHVESPEADQAYNSALADYQNKSRIAARMKSLLKKKLVSQQEADQAFAAADVAEATLRTQKVIRDYQNVLAPFDGVISDRFVDPGTLIQNASASQSASQPLFTLTQNQMLRIFIYIDQNNAPFVHLGDLVDITVPGQIEGHTQGRVERIAGALDPKTRTLLTEIVLPNPAGKIVAGSFVQAQMKVATPIYLELPVQALTIRNGETDVILVDPEGKAHFTKIDLAYNDGEHLLIRSGIQEGDRVALDVGNTVQEGQKLQPVLAQAGHPNQPDPSAGQHAGQAAGSTPRPDFARGG